ncbi:MAG TPA: HEAT repeat domain-containing protein [Isosphaeraceae bacterium]|nr:HEAT repeat domain-containing protein [Isosphaeraceae bacterium]
MDDASLSKTQWIRLIALILVVAAAASTGCSTYIGTTSKSFLHQVRDNPDPNIRYIAYSKLGVPSAYDNQAQKDEAIGIMIAKLREAKEPVAVRAVIVRSLGNLGDRRARQEIIKAANDVENAVIRVEACRALGKVGQPEDATILARIMTIDKLEDCRIAAIEGLGMLKAQDPRIFNILLDGMDHDDPAIRLECLRALREITGKDAGVDPAAWRRELEPTLKELAAKSVSPGTAALKSTPR